MSLLTRCPACTTLYKVVPDQLRISQGWVKCGQCGEIFDATQHLIEASTEPEEPTVHSAFGPAVVAPQDVTDSTLEQSVEVDSTIAQQQDDFSVSESNSEFRPEPPGETSQNLGENAEVDTPAQDEQGGQEEVAPLLSDSEQLLVSAAVLDSSALIPDDGPQLRPQQETEPQAMAGTEDAAALTPSFMRDARPKSVWIGRWRHRTLWAVGALLVVVLGSQWVYQDHDRLAASRPQWRPTLDTLCSILRCSVAPLQQIESVAIDAAAFSKGEQGHYRLTFALKNTANLMLAVPSIELTLTDVQDRVVVRRVISPPELVAATDHLAANAELPVMVNLRLQTETSAASVVGYRLLAFYP